MDLNVKSGIFTVLSANVHDLVEELTSAIVSCKIEADGAAGKLVVPERIKLKPSRTKGVLHGYVIRNDKRVFQFFYNIAARELTCKALI